MTAGLNEIYKAIGEFTGTMKALGEKMDGLKGDMVASEAIAAASRANMHRRLDDLVERTGHLETDMTTVKDKVARVESVSDDVVAMRQQATGAGTLGRWLVKVGIGVITVAGWIVGAYTYLTGRPPP